MRTGTTYPVRPQIILGATLGVFVGGLTLSISRLSLLSDNHLLAMLQRSLLMIILPGIIVSEILGGNVHAWHLWIAVVMNLLLYALIGWLSYRLMTALVRKSYRTFHR